MSGPIFMEELDKSKWEILTVVMVFSDTYDLSKTETKKLLKSGGLYINNIKIMEDRFVTVEEDFLYGRYCLLRKGKKDYRLLSIKN